MFKIEVYVPGAPKATDLYGFVDYVTDSLGSDQPSQLPDVFVVSDPKQGLHTEITAVG